MATYKRRIQQILEFGGISLLPNLRIIDQREFGFNLNVPTLLSFSKLDQFGGFTGGTIDLCFAREIWYFKKAVAVCSEHRRYRMVFHPAANILRFQIERKLIITKSQVICALIEPCDAVRRMLSCRLILAHQSCATPRSLKAAIAMKPEPNNLGKLETIWNTICHGPTLPCRSCA